MEYFRILNLGKEPFSNSPEPDFFYQSDQHRTCLQQLELAIRLKRGLNVVIGDVGTGKTTLCRQLILKFNNQDITDQTIKTHLLMDPAFGSALEFLLGVSAALDIDLDITENSERQIKEIIKHHLFERCIKNGEIVLLIIDEGQKLPDYCLEILREFLNYETNENKLLQIVIFAQKEFIDIIKKYPNFTDRINQFHHLYPLSFHETRRLIEYRIGKASGEDSTPQLFSSTGIWAVYYYAGGYPRKIIHLCHQVMLALIIQSSPKATWRLIRSCAKRLSPARPMFPFHQYALRILIFVILLSAGYGLMHTAKAAWSKGGETKYYNWSWLSNNGDGDDISDNRNYKKYKPEILGVMRIEKGDTIFQLLADVYGQYDPVLIESLKRFNPHIADINRLAPGDMVKIPAITSKENQGLGGGCVVRIAAKNTLNEALKYIRQCNQEGRPVHLLPYWNKEEGLAFAVTLAGLYKNETIANDQLKKSHANLKSESQVICRWVPGTEFYKR